MWCWGGGLNREDQNEMRKSVPTLTPILLGSPLLKDAQSGLQLCNSDALKSNVLATGSKLHR